MKEILKKENDNLKAMMRNVEKKKEDIKIINEQTKITI